MTLTEWKNDNFQSTEKINITANFFNRPFTSFRNLNTMMLLEKTYYTKSTQKNKMLGMI